MLYFLEQCKKLFIIYDVKKTKSNFKNIFIKILSFVGNQTNLVKFWVFFGLVWLSCDLELFKEYP
jgi:hypothetical protein